LGEGYVFSPQTRNITPGWYRYNNSLNIPTIPPQRGQCGSWNPIWLNGNVLIFNCTRNKIGIPTTHIKAFKLSNILRVVEFFVLVTRPPSSSFLITRLPFPNVLENYDGETLRYFIMSSHYRSPLNFSDENLDNAKASQMPI
jgi:hypothetical protein